jgi:hypothetical protein
MGMLLLVLREGKEHGARRGDRTDGDPGSLVKNRFMAISSEAGDVLRIETSLRRSP